MKYQTNKSALVTGATGFVGRHLVAALLEKGYSVRALVRDRKKFHTIFQQSAGIELIEGDLGNIQALESGLDGVSLLFHVAGVTKTPQTNIYYNVNHKATKRLYELVRKNKYCLDKIIHISSLAAVGPCDNPEPPENFQDPHPISHYGRSKLLGEQEARQMMDHCPVTIIRPPAVFGPADTDVLMFFKMVSKGILPLIGNNKKRVSLVYVEDLASGIVMAAESDSANGKAYFLCYDTPFQWKELGELASRILGRKARSVRIPHWVVFGVGAMSEFIHRITGGTTKLNMDTAREMIQSYWICSCEPAKRDFGYSSRHSIEDAFRKTITWYQDHGKLPAF